MYDWCLDSAINIIVETRVSYKISLSIPPQSGTRRLFILEKLSKILKVKWFLLAVDGCSDTKPVPVLGGKPQRVAEVPVWFLLLDTDS